MTFQPFVQEAPEDCPVCGAEAGKCPHAGVPMTSPLLFVEWSPDHLPPPERTPTMADVIATERIYEEVPIARSDRTRRVLRYGIGAVIPEADVDRLEVSKAGTQKSVPMAPTDESGAVVPLTQTPPSARTREPVTSGSAKAAARKAPAKKATGSTKKAR